MYLREINLDSVKITRIEPNSYGITVQAFGQVTVTEHCMNIPTFNSPWNLCFTASYKPAPANQFQFPY